jgi:sugar transferase (PEP-CTERM system associated)
MLKLFRHHVSAAGALQLLLDGWIFYGVLLLVGQIQLGPYGADASVFVAPGAAFAGVMTLVCAALGLYQRDEAAGLGVFMGRAALGVITGAFAVYLVFEVLPGGRAVQGTVWIAALFAFIGVVTARVTVNAVTRASPLSRRVLIVGTGPEANEVAAVLNGSQRVRHDVVGFYETGVEAVNAPSQTRVFSRSADLLDLVRRLEISEVIVAVREQRGGVLPIRHLLDCRVSGVAVLDLPAFYERVRGEVPIDSLKASWLIYGQGFAQDAFRTVVKRLFDYVASMVLLVVALPVMALTAVAIWLESPGAILYRQERVGRGGRVFECLKFRSMRADAEANGVAQWAHQNDTRITRVGRFIRKYRIDELPQLLNVLRGEMSLVGPRPERPCFVKQLKEQVRFYDLRHSVKPGLTGWAQVRYSYGASVEDSTRKLQFDLYYVKNHSLFLDLIVLVETVRVVLFGVGSR